MGESPSEGTPKHGAATQMATMTELAEQMAAVFEEGVPARLRAPEIFTAEEVFGWICAAHPPHREKNSLAKIRALKTVWGLCPPEEPDHEAADPGRPAELYREGGLILDPTPYLPTASTTGFDAWVADTRRRLGGDFGMQAPGIESASHLANRKLQTLLAPTLAQTGPRGYRFNAFLGDYRITPFGYHVDPHHEAVFQFNLIGRRTGEFWEGLLLQDEDAEWIEDSNGLHPPRKPAELSFELEPGDLVFWPGTHAHGFRCTGPSMALSLVIERSAPRSRAEVAQGLKVASLGGSLALPAIDRQVELNLSKPIDFPAAYPICFERYDDELLIAVCGRNFEWPERASIPAAIRLFDRLNDHRRMRGSVEAEALIESCACPELPAEEVAGTLSMLLAFGFLHQS